MSFLVKVEWAVFRTKFLNNPVVFVKEDEDKWSFLTSESNFIIQTDYPKHADPTDDMFFIETYFAGRQNISRVLEIEERILHTPPEEEFDSFDDISDDISDKELDKVNEVMGVSDEEIDEKQEEQPIEGTKKATDKKEELAGEIEENIGSDNIQRNV